MGTELLRACLNEEDLDFPAVPPGFESFTSFKVKVENADSEPCCSVSSNPSRQEPVHVKLEHGIGGGGKISRSLRRRPSNSYGRYNQCSDEESDCEQLDQNFPTKSGLTRGVIRGCPECPHCQKVVARWHPDAACRPDLEEVPVFYPSEEEFKDTIRFIEKIRPKAERYGICRIIPPPTWNPPCPLKEKHIWEKAKFGTRVQKVDKLQNRDASRKQSKVHTQARKKRRCVRMGVECGPGNGNAFELGEPGFGFEPGPDFTLDEFQRYANAFKSQYFRSVNSTDSVIEEAKSTDCWEPLAKDIEGEYWRVVEKPTEEIEVLYGADLETGVFGSGFPKFSAESFSDADEEYVKSGWNLNNLPRLAGSLLSYENAEISGVQVPWLYVGMCFSSFCWHVEDHHLYSLNYMHFGAPKMWYGVPGSDAVKLEAAMKKHLPDLFDEQPDLLHKLVTQLSPSILKSAGVPVYRCMQSAGEFVLTFPRAYHAGFNCGFNCAEAVNVAPLDWLPHGLNAVELYREQRRKTTISHDKLLLGAAREAVKANWELNLLRKNTIDNLRWKDVCGRDGILATSLRARVDAEHARREFLCKHLKALKMESTFDATTERECYICFFDLHLSAAGCRCSPDRFACLNHAKQLCSCSWDAKFFLFRYDITELNLLVDALEGKLSAIYRWARLDLGLALSSCISKDNRPVMGISGAFPEHPGDNTACKTNLQSIVPFKSKDVWMKNQTVLALGGGTSSVERGKFSDAVLALGATKIPPIKLFRQIKPKSDKPQINKVGGEVPAYNPGDCTHQLFSRDTLSNNRSTLLESMKSSSHRQDNLICLSDDEDEQSTKPICDTGTTCQDSPKVPQIERSDHKLNLCDLANAALAAEANLSLMCDGHKDDCMSCSTSPNNEAEVKCETVGLYDEHNISCHQGSIGSSVEKRDPDASTPDSFHQHTTCAPNVGYGIKFRDESVIQRVIDEARTLPGSPSCSQSSVDKYPRQRGPRIAKVVRRINCKVELLESGVVNLGNLWSSSRAIFPKGFKSRVSYINFSDPTNFCNYISEILDGGSKGPLFMVSMEHDSNEIFVHFSPTRCWEMVLERVNQEISKQHKLGKTKLPPLQPPGSLDGLEMFGFSSPAIVQVIEALDKNRVCANYWNSRPLSHISQCFQPRGNNRNTYNMSEKQNVGGSDTILRRLIKKADAEELHSLIELLGKDHSHVTRVINEEIENRSR
ncbi:putative lysine-specific demethylase JMJ16 isoform X1 [Amaranthus tricolor]|uniref:putative lysine-specific demethylase JMJ16 isoform X1 n=1 Tax=Amaranthus tricolor TaxID=29722 RepID=UPI002590D661|nr:putative lysine-specific demethylase JMJ16 isoform X1 [Amaranthus tricolor]XP_057540085.1 putative lysine-specific demethylase JMJ16 isoform X1 [Amaranthus tricolor]XP_057540086.1 putative lysine-specific demethylase JMJ16 isoform X1 [Amaranthus tricolor]